MRYTAATPAGVASAGPYQAVFRRSVDGTAANDTPIGSASTPPLTGAGATDSLPYTIAGLSVVAVYSQGNEVWNGHTAVYEPWQDANYALGYYSVAAPQDGGGGTHSMRYTAATPAGVISAGAYDVVFRRSVDGTAANDSPIGSASSPGLTGAFAGATQVVGNATMRDGQGNALAGQTVTFRLVSTAGGVNVDAWLRTNFTTISDDAGLCQVTLAQGGVYQARYAGRTWSANFTSPIVDTATITGGPTGGTFTLSVTSGGTTTTTAGIAYNAAASAVQMALQGLANVGNGNVTVTGSAGGPYTIFFAGSLGPVTLAASGAGLTGGTGPSVAVVNGAAGGSFELPELLGDYGS